MGLEPVLVANGLESRLQLVLGNAEGLILSHESASSGRLMTRLAPALDQMLSTLGLSVGDLGGIAAVRGPGSFTGVRLVLATVLGMARGKNLPLAGLDYLPLLAAGPAPLLSGELWTVTYARKGQVYLQGFSCPNAVPLTPARAIGLDQAAALLAARHRPLHLIGSACRKNPGWLQEHGLEGKTLPCTWDHPVTSALLETALAADYTTSPLAPCYLRPSDAEQNLAAIAAGRGVSEQKTRSRLPRYQDPC